MNFIRMASTPAPAPTVNIIITKKSAGVQRKRRSKSCRSRTYKSHSAATTIRISRRQKLILTLIMRPQYCRTSRLRTSPPSLSSKMTSIHSLKTNLKIQTWLRKTRWQSISISPSETRKALLNACTDRRKSQQGRETLESFSLRRRQMPVDNSVWRPELVYNQESGHQRTPNNVSIAIYEGEQMVVQCNRALLRLIAMVQDCKQKTTVTHLNSVGLK